MLLRKKMLRTSSGVAPIRFRVEFVGLHLLSIIDKKRNLMDEVVKEDDFGLLKSFILDDLIEVLAAPSQAGINPGQLS